MSSKHNFCFPVRDLENERILITPYISSEHAEPIFNAYIEDPRFFEHIPTPIFTSAQNLSEYLFSAIESLPGSMLYAIYDKTHTSYPSPSSFAGMVGFLNSSATALQTEIGPVIVLPAFQRKNLASNAVGLLLFYALDLPDAGGLGLRRVAWMSSPKNQASIHTAERMGFVKEGLLRWTMVWPAGAEKVSNGLELRKDDPLPGCLGRDTTVLSLCWDDWENGARDRVQRVMARTR